uniref:EF-hand domain-containing protein n=1 Tax=Pyrodinium bahamense TaxID=73915 RepID=A0A7S0ASR6_9DINO
MSSKFAKQYRIPPEFPDILKDFTREVLRNQPPDINEFAAKYFDCLANGLPADAKGGQLGADDEPDMSLEEVEGIIQDLFRKYDRDGNQFLDPQEFKALMEDLQQRLDFPKDQVYLFLAEADMNADGMIEYEEFIPLALQIIQGMYAKKRLEQHMTNVDQHAEDLLVHGMSRDELTELVSSIFERMDQDQSGFLCKQEFVAALMSMELGLTRREINTIMFQIDQDRDGNISYREFVPFAFDLLQKLTSLRLLETELENDDFAQFLNDLFRAKDTEMMGTLSVDEVRDILHQAMLGLTRMQIYTVISEADITQDDRIAYTAFIPRAVGLIRSMLSFEKSIARETKDAGPEAEDHFYYQLDEAFAGVEIVPLMDFMARLEQCNVVDNRELQASKHLLSAYGDEVPVEDAKAQIWALVKSMRRHKISD